jgi:hypothetical protein
MKTKCYSVRLQCLASISEKCYRATAFDGSEALIPKSQVYGQDHDVQKSDAYWITAWILDQKQLQHSNKKVGYFDSITGKRLSDVTIEVHTPEPIEAKPIEADESLTR